MINRMSIALAVVLVIGSVSACASTSAAGAQSGVRRADCEARPQDSVFALRGPVFRDCDVDKRAKLTSTNIHPDFHAPSGSSNGCYSADLEYVVNTEGEIERTTEDALAQAIVSMLPQLRFEPAVRDGVPVRMIFIDHQSIAFARVLVPAGSARPNGPPRGSVQTKC